MNNHHTCPAPAELITNGVDAIGGPGAIRSLSAIVPLLLVLEKSEIRSFRTIGGISGGTLPLVMIAAGYSAKEVVNHVLDINFNDYVDWGRSHYQVIAAHLADGRRRQQLPTKGVYHTARLGAHIEALVSARVSGWPEKFWTVALDGTPPDGKRKDSSELPQILMNAGGIFRRYKDGTLEQLSEEPAPLGLAIRASCAVPMAFEPVQMPLPSGDKLLLFDGALSWEGAIPLGLVDSISPNPEQQLIVDVGDEVGVILRAMSTAVRMLCGGKCLPNFNTSAIARDEKRILVAPTITAVRSFDFDASRDTKWLAIAEGFVPAAQVFQTRGLLTGKHLEDAKDISAEMFNIVRSAPYLQPGEVSKRMEKALTIKGWL